MHTDKGGILDEGHVYTTIQYVLTQSTMVSTHCWRETFPLSIRRLA